MREIKFRAWNGENMISPDYIDRAGIAWWKENSIPTMSKELMQYVGIKDAHGVMVYEGDIIDVGHKQGVIVWYGEGFSLAEINTKCCEEQYNGKTPYKVYLSGEHCVEMDTIQFYDPHRTIQVIGNIHANPELIK